MNTPQTWLPFDPDTCPQGVDIIIWNKKSNEVTIANFYMERYGPRFSTNGATGYDWEDVYDYANLPTHYMLAPQPPKE